LSKPTQLFFNPFFLSHVAISIFPFFSFPLIKEKKKVERGKKKDEEKISLGPQLMIREVVTVKFSPLKN